MAKCIKDLIKVLFVDDEEDLLRTINIVLGNDFQISTANTVIKALDILSENSIDVVVCDISMPDINGLELLKRIKKQSPDIEVVMLTALNDTQLAIHSAKEGAYNFLTKPFDPQAIKITINRAYEKKCLLYKNHILEDNLHNMTHGCFSDIIGKSPVMQKIFDLVTKVSKNDSAVLIQGETGTGKEMVAKAICNLSSRKDMPFITVNCGAIPRELFESEFFGFEKGAFSGAVSDKKGKFEAADNGTLFLDEIAALPLEMQVKLLRVIQEKEVTRIGSNKTVSVNVRLVSACNENLKEKIKKGEFREDLFHRIAIVTIDLPPLRKRGDDILLLAYSFIKKFNDKYHKDFAILEETAMEVMKNYAWPGNVRELEHLMERLVSLEEGKEIKSSSLPLEMFLRKITDSDLYNCSYKQLVEQFEKSLLEAALRKSDSNQTKAAQLLGLSRTTLISKMESLGLKLK